ncbi:MAG: 37kDa nucleoid-associated protein [Anaerospora sp.]|nr:37kDa nucleoid-associated protein [Anaerospora sp.]
MFELNHARIDKLAIHKVGNKLKGEGMTITPALYPLTDGNLEEILLKYFLSSFKSEQLYSFHHETDIHLNEVYMCVSRAFINKQNFYDQSVNVLKCLYENSTNPKVKQGEFYMVYLADCILDGQAVDAIGIFKTENKDTYLRISEHRLDITIACEDGINVRHFHTETYLNLCRDFSENVYGQMYQADKKDQVSFINNSVAYFEGKSSFDLNDFAEQVIGDPELMHEFKQHKKNYDLTQEKVVQETFDISNGAVKSMKRKMKSNIKLDTGVDIQVKSGLEDATRHIERGFDDEKGMHFYKVYFNNEE